MKKIYILSAIAALALTGCSNDDIVLNSGTHESESDAIRFTSLAKSMQRADHTGADAAEMLGQKFVVEGTKGATVATDGGITTNVVYDNYNVVWTVNTAGTTPSNTADWEYVGQGKNDNASADIAALQTVKYWDYSQDQYDFIAYSAGNNTVVTPSGTYTSGTNLQVSPITPATATTSAYTVKGTTDLLKNFYVADLVTVENAHFGEEVQIKFRNLSAKVRLGFYETIPGYSVKDIEFYESSSATEGDEVTDATLYSGSDNIYSEGTYTVFYPTVKSTDDQAAGYQASDMNKAHVTFDPAKDASDNVTGADSKSVYKALTYTRAQASTKIDEKYLGTASNAPTWAGTSASDAYVNVLPNESASALNLRVNYTLVSDDGSKETIKVWGATAVVPAEYTQWKSNYAYTYLFKISDNTNGATEKLGGAVTGLRPITFDAVVVETEDGLQETVTTVATPSITTYMKGQNVTVDNEYPAGEDLYVMVNLNGTNKNDLATKGQMYKVEKTGAAEISEATVYDALNIVASTATGVVTGRNGIKLTEQTTDATVTEIPRVDGNVVTVAAGEAAKFTTATGTYAYVYTVAAGTATTFNTAVSVAASFDFDSANETYYTDFDCTTPATGTTTAAGIYYQKLTNNNTTYAVKVIKVQ